MVEVSFVLFLGLSCVQRDQNRTQQNPEAHYSAVLAVMFLPSLESSGAAKRQFIRQEDAQVARDGAPAGCQDPVLCAAASPQHCHEHRQPYAAAQTSRLRACRETKTGQQNNCWLRKRA